MKNLLVLLLCVLFLSACADVTSSGKKVHFIESDKEAVDFQEKADFLEAKHDCEFIGFTDPNTAHFPPSYSTYENEIHAALRNSAAKMGGNVVIANFYKKPAQGIVMNCPEEYFQLKI